MQKLQIRSVPTEFASFDLVCMSCGEVILATLAPKYSGAALQFNPDMKCNGDGTHTFAKFMADPKSATSVLVPSSDAQDYRDFADDAEKAVQQARAAVARLKSSVPKEP